MKNLLFSRVVWMLVILPISIFIKAQNPAYLCELRNDVQTSSTVFEFDIYLVQTGSTAFEYAAGQFGIMVNPLIKNGGIITPSIVAGSSDATLVSNNQNPTAINYLSTNCIAIAGRVPPGSGNGTIISNASPGVKVCRVRLTNTVPFGQFSPGLTWTTGAPYPTQIYAYVGGLNTSIMVPASQTTSNLIDFILNQATTPTITSGPSTVIVHSTGNIYTTEPGKSNYIWNVSTGGLITNGGGTTDNSVTVTWNTVGPQSISINYTDGGVTAPSPTVFPVTVNPIAVTVTGITANKTYDGTTVAPLNTTAAVLVGVTGGDVVTLNSSGVTGNFANKNVGNSKPVTLTGLYSLSGAGAGNYTLTQPVISGDITPAALTILGVTANNKIYDRLTTATLSGTPVLTGVITPDVVTVSGTPVATFASSGVGSGIAVTVTGYMLGGTGANNYSVTQPAGLTASITAKALTITGVIVNNKVYDGNTTAVLIGTPALSGVIAPDDVTISGSPVATFVTSGAGSGKAVTVTGYSLGGANSANYSVTQPALTANITAKPLSISGVIASNKIYNRTTTAVLTGTPVLSGIISPDVVTVTGTPVATFASSGVGSGIAVTVTGYMLGGTGANNYTVTQPAGLSADITPKTLTISGIAANNKVYDGTTAGSLTGVAALTGVISPDVVTLIGPPVVSFATAEVGSGIAVTVTGYALGGTDAGNYALIQPAGLTADITGKILTITGITADNKEYDGTTSVTISGTAVLSGVTSGDIVNLSGAPVAAFDSPNAGSAVGVTVSGYTISGAQAGTYTLIQPSLTADITAKPLIITGVSGVNKEYDQTTVATLSGTVSLTGVIAPDLVTVAGIPVAAFATSGVGTSIAVTVTGYTLSGAQSANYTPVQPTGLMADITPASLTVTGVSADSKEYDGTTLTTLNTAGAVLNGVLGSESVSVVPAGATGNFIDKNVGTAKTVLISDFALTGTDAGNYTLVQPAIKADITAKPITVTAADQTKAYGSTLVFTGNEYTSPGIIAGDAITGLLITSPGTGAASAIGAYAITIGGGTNSNYTISYTDGTLTVVKANLTFTADNQIRDYLVANSELTFVINGFVNGETQAVLDAMPVIETTATQNSDAGVYPITVSGGTDNNYNFVYEPGTLTIMKIAQTIVFTDVPADLLVTDVYTLAATSSSGLPVLFECVNPQYAMVSGNQLTGVGRGTASIRAYSDGETNYMAAEAFANVEIISTHVNILHLFTPNNDGFNDTWEIPQMATYGTCDVRVFNRWGKQVYANKDYDNLWDGISAGSPLPSGAYYFIIKTENSGTITGTVNIVR